MASITIRLPDNLKTEAVAASQELGITLSDIVRTSLEYVAVHKKLPVQKKFITDEDSDLVDIIRAREATGIRIPVSLHDL